MKHLSPFACACLIGFPPIAVYAAPAPPLTESRKHIAVTKMMDALWDGRDQATHLPASHRGHPGQEDVYFLYDLAHNAMELHLAGRQSQAEELLDYVAARMRIPQEKIQSGKNIYGGYGIQSDCNLKGYRLRGMVNALDRTSHSPNGAATMDIFVTPGPNAWLGLAFDMVNPEKYQVEMRLVGDYLLSMQNADGGFIDGTRATTRVHVEPHNDAYAFLRNLGERTGDARYQRAAARAKRWFLEKALNEPTGQILQGVWDGKPSRIHATDAYTWGVAVYENDFSYSLIKRLVDQVEAKSLVRIAFTRADHRLVDVVLPDFTDPSSAELQRPKNKPMDGDHRGAYHPVGTVEWAGGFILMYQIAAAKAWNANDPAAAIHYKARAEAMLSYAYDSLHEHDGKLYGGYATGQNVATGHGWLTPLWSRPDDGSVSSDWLVFPSLGVNPFSPRDTTLAKTLAAIPNVPLADAKKELQAAVKHPAYHERAPRNVPDEVGYRMEPFFFLKHAWADYERGESGDPQGYRDAIRWAALVATEWEDLAAREEKLKEREVGGLVQTFSGQDENNDPGSAVFSLIWKTPLLNEMGSAGWILATSNHELHDDAAAKKWIRWLIQKMPEHQIHDPERKQYWNALVGWEYNPDGSQTNAEMGTLYREVLAELNLASAAPRDVPAETLAGAYGHPALQQANKAPFYLETE